MKDVKWPTALLVLGGLAVFGFLTWQDKDGKSVIDSLLPFLLMCGLAYQQAEIKKDSSAIRENTNGNVAQLVNELALARKDIVTLADKLAEMQPAPKDSDASLK